MRKKLIIAAAAAAISAMLSVPAFAAEWKSDATGWWYQNDDGSYPSNGWTWVEGKCYYFTPEGYCLINTQTPDGYTVDASGAWVVNGAVQTQGNVPAGNSVTAEGTVIQWNGLTFTVPAGFVQDTTETEGAFFLDESRVAAIVIVTEVIPDMEGYESLLNTMQGVLLDEAVEEYVGTPSSKSPKQFSSGTWYSYDFTDASRLGLPGSLRIYIRHNGAQIEMIMFIGNLSGMDLDGIMNNNLR